MLFTFNVPRVAHAHVVLILKNQNFIFVLCRYPGFHFIPPKENPEFTLIYDKNGFIAGMQSLVSKKATIGAHYDFETADWYDKDVIKGMKIVVVEAMYLIPFCFLNVKKIANE